MILTPGAYLKHRRTAAGLAIEDVAHVLATDPRIAEHARADWLRRIEADVVPLSFPTIAALREAFAFDPTVLVQLGLVQIGMDVEPPRLCLLCACSEDDRCGLDCYRATDVAPGAVLCTCCAALVDAA